MSYSISDILEGLKKRINSNSELLIQVEGGEVEKAKFEFSLQAETKDINLLTEKYNIKLPQDYIDFLLIHNGAKLFDIGFGEYTEIYSINQVIETSELIPDALPSLLPIARCPSYQVFLDTLCTENNIFINKGASEFDFTGLTFKGWLESLIITNGNSYFERVPFFLFRTIDDGKLKTKDWIINHFDNE